MHQCQINWNFVLLLFVCSLLVEAMPLGRSANWLDAHVVCRSGVRAWTWFGFVSVRRWFVVDDTSSGEAWAVSFFYLIGYCPCCIFSYELAKVENYSIAISPCCSSCSSSLCVMVFWWQSIYFAHYRAAVVSFIVLFYSPWTLCRCCDRNSIFVVGGFGGQGFWVDSFVFLVPPLFCLARGVWPVLSGQDVATGRSLYFCVLHPCLRT